MTDQKETKATDRPIQESTFGNVDRQHRQADRDRLPSQPTAAHVIARIKTSAVILADEGAYTQFPPVDTALLVGPQVFVAKSLLESATVGGGKASVLLPISVPTSNDDAETLLKHHADTVDARDTAMLLEKAIDQHFDGNRKKATKAWPALERSLVRQLAGLRRILPEVSEAINASSHFPRRSELYEVSKGKGVDEQLAVWRAIEAGESRAARRRKKLDANGRTSVPSPRSPETASQLNNCAPFEERHMSTVADLETLQARFQQLASEPDWPSRSPATRQRFESVLQNLTKLNSEPNVVSPPTDNVSRETKARGGGRKSWFSRSVPDPKATPNSIPK